MVKIIMIMNNLNICSAHNYLYPRSQFNYFLIIIVVLFCGSLFLSFCPFSLVHCIVCPSSLWSIALSVLLPFGPLHCLSFFPLVHCIVCPSSLWSIALSVLLPFGPLHCLSFFPLAHCIVCPSSLWSIALSVLLPFGPLHCLSFFPLVHCIVCPSSLWSIALSVLLPFGPLHCLSFFPLVSSNYSKDTCTYNNVRLELHGDAMIDFWCLAPLSA